MAKRPIIVGFRKKPKKEEAKEKAVGFIIDPRVYYFAKKKEVFDAIFKFEEQKKKLEEIDEKLAEMENSGRAKSQ